MKSESDLTTRLAASLDIPESFIYLLLDDGDNPLVSDLKTAVRRSVGKGAFKSPEPLQLRVWHIPQVPMQPFHVAVASIEQAILVLHTLAQYDLFQFNHNVKPDYSNASGLEVWEDGEWCEWSDEYGNQIDDVMREMEED